MTQRPTLLLIEPWYCYPPWIGGLQRHYHLARHLAPHFQITLVAPPNTDPIPHVDYLPDYPEMGIELVLAKRDRRLRHRVRRKIKYTAKSLWRRIERPADWVEWLSHDDLHQAAKRAVAGRRFDFTVLSATWLANFVGWLPREQRGVTVLNTQNVESALWNQWWRETPPGPLREDRRRDWQAVVRYERRWFPRQEAIVSCSPGDDAWAAEHFPGIPHAMVPNGIDCSLYEPAPEGAELKSGAFIGLLNSAANEQGVCWFSREILPAIVREEPAFRFLVAGKDPTVRVQELAGPNVEVIGFVKHAQDVLRRAGIVVVPLIQGGGTRNKIMEAFAAQKAVVSTAKGCEGLDVRHERDILIADQPAEFAAQVVRLLRDAGLRQRLGEAGRRLVKATYDWPIVAGSFREFLMQLKEQRRCLC